MGLFEKIFPKKEKAREVSSYFQTLNGYTPAFETFEGGLYEMELTRAAIGTIAKYASKLTPVISGAAMPALAKQIGYSPNPWMDTPTYISRIVTILLINNNAFIVPLKDRYGALTGFYPILPENAEVVDYQGEAYLRYRFGNGQAAALPFSEVGRLVKYQYRDDFFGESNAPIRTTMQLINSNNQGIINSVKNSAYIRFLAKINNMIAPEDIEKERERFANANLSSQNKSGVMMYDNKISDIKEIQSKPYVVSKAQMDYINANVFDYFGINEHIMQSNYSEDEWNAFYEGTIEPLALQLSMAHTNMTFTPREISFGNEFIFSANRLQYASNTTKLNVSTQLFDRGLLNRNQIMDIWNLPHVEGGDEYFIRKEYANINNLGEDETNAGSEGKGVSQSQSASGDGDE